MIYEIVKGENNSTLISNGEIVKLWNYQGEEKSGFDIQLFNVIKNDLGFKKDEFESFEEAKRASEKSK